jgi:hypothetical protein
VREIELGVGGLGLGVAVGEQHAELGLAAPLGLRGGRGQQCGDDQEIAEIEVHDLFLGHCC